MGTAVDDCFSPTYHVPSGTSRAKAGSVSSDPFGRKLRHGRSRERRSQRGRHHAKGTRYVGEIGFIAAMLAPLASSRPVHCDPFKSQALECELGTKPIDTEGPTFLDARDHA